MAVLLEEGIWNALKNETAPNKKKILFHTYQNIALIGTALQNLYAV